MIDDIKTLLNFSKNTCFNHFATEFMNNRQEAELSDEKWKSLFSKISLNGLYEYDAMNTKNYCKTSIVDKNKAESLAMKQTFRNMTEIGDDVYQVFSKNKYYHCGTCLHEAFFTLDNAKYCYLVFIYDFMAKCLDPERFHFIEGGNDSVY